MTLTPLVIILSPFVLLIIVLLFVTLNRYIGYKERVALARLGFSVEDLNRAAGPRRHGSRGVLWGGVITAMSGLALLLGLATLGVGAWLLAGLLPLFVGLGMVIVYFTTPDAVPSSELDEPATVIQGEGAEPQTGEGSQSSEQGETAPEQAGTGRD